ncbi:MAG: 30S ribosomal protein S6 [Spirochaetaceae bacterium]|jgi:small subunit ribosomal protein S6|nr:30S ribosomal protein S6 [Spirochaetaceae bacterium]
MRQYELIAIFPIEEEQHKAGRDKLIADLTAAGVEIEKTDEMGDRDLAYEIKKIRRGKYVLFSIKADGGKIEVLDKAFKLNSNLIRHLFVKKDE